jgi:hypothetical protein
MSTRVRRRATGWEKAGALGTVAAALAAIAGVWLR